MSALALAAMTLAAGQATAAGYDAFGADAIKVPVAKLNLQDRRDAKILLQRIDAAAMQVCGGSIWSSPDEWAAVRESGCHTRAVARAVAAVNAPTLSSLYADRLAIASN